MLCFSFPSRTAISLLSSPPCTNENETFVWALAVTNFFLQKYAKKKHISRVLLTRPGLRKDLVYLYIQYNSLWYTVRFAFES